MKSKLKKKSFKKVMIFFGLDYKTFRCKFEEYFTVEHISSFIKIRDRVSKNCIVHFKIPFIISESKEDLIKSIYIQIFKHVDSFYLRYDDEEFKMYNKIRKNVDEYSKLYLKKRDKLSIDFYNLVKEMAMNQANNLCYNRIPGKYMYDDINTASKLGKKIKDLDEEATYQNKILVL